jgi:Sec-independent protein secretion pathway component TatC
MGASCCFSARLTVAVYIRRLIIVALLKSFWIWLRKLVARFVSGELKNRSRRIIAPFTTLAPFVFLGEAKAGRG